MAQHYSDPKRETEEHALPNVEVWEDRVSIIHCSCGDYEVPYDHAHAEAETYCPSCEREALGNEDQEPVEDTDRAAWWWWTCLPGCMPDSSVNGPFDSEAEALADAREGMED